MVTRLEAETAPEAGGAAPSGAPGQAGRSVALTARGVTVDFDGLRAIGDVSLELRHGEILGLIGPNGAGKTTLVNVLTGFQSPSAGATFIGGEPTAGWSPHRVARAGVARTFQTGRFFRNLTVAENVEVGAVGLGLGRRRARERAGQVLEAMGLADRRDDEAATLGHGQERRLSIARALAMRPRFLLLDEPAAGLNEAESRELVELVSRLPDQLACGVLVIEHDMQVIMTLCERIQVLDHGATISIGTPDQVRGDDVVIRAYLGAPQEEGADASG